MVDKSFLTTQSSCVYDYANMVGIPELVGCSDERLSEYTGSFEIVTAAQTFLRSRQRGIIIKESLLKNQKARRLAINAASACLDQRRGAKAARTRKQRQLNEEETSDG